MTSTDAVAGIRPFVVRISEPDLADLRHRLTKTRWPQALPGDQWERGVPPAYLTELVAYWADKFDWRGYEARLNEQAQFVTTIDGQPIHFLHVRSPEPGALPLIATHGYPSSVVEYLKMIGPLVDPRAHGADPADAFHLVVPSLPGFGFSTPVTDAGWGLSRTTHAFAELMHRLGYARYGAHGSDIGSGVSGMLGAIAADRVVGIHVTSDPTALALLDGIIPPEVGDLPPSEMELLDQVRRYGADGRGYLQIQGTRPQTLAYLLTDSPAGQLAWIAEKFQEWTNPTWTRPEDAIGVDTLLATASLYWFTQTGTTAANFIYEVAHAGDWPPPSPTPQGWAIFNANPLMRRFLDPDRKIEHWSEFREGGHFPAMEVPELLVADIRAFFRRYR